MTVRSRLFFLVIWFALCFVPAHALEIPRLKRSDLSTAVQILGFNTSARLLSNPFPLGGYSGFEIGYSYEIINTQDLGLLGDGTAARQNDFNYSRLSVGKGLYNNLDVYIHFLPFTKREHISEYGGVIKWNFYQATYVPFSLSILLHGSTINIQDAFVNETLGADLLAGINVDNFALYFGAGALRAKTAFMNSILFYCTAPNTPAGCDATLPSTEPTLREKYKSSHSFVGLNIDFGPIFIAAQIDRYETPVYSLKLGYRK